MLLTIIFPILLLTSSFSTNQLCPQCSVFSGYFEMGGYTNNSMPVYNNQPTPKNRFSKGKMQVHITNSWFGIIDLGIGMKGYLGQHSFKEARGGGEWYAIVNLTDNVSLKYQHYSCHVFDAINNPSPNCGSEDGFFIKFTFGMNEARKYKSSLLKKILGR